MSKHFKTNYFKKQKQRYLKRLIVILFFFIFLSMLTYFIVFSGFFKIKNVQIYGLKRVPKEILRKEIDNILNEQKLLSLNNNLFFINTASINKIFLADINNIYVTKNFLTKTLNIHVNEKKPIAKIILQSNESAFDNNINNFYLDENGKIFKSTLLNNQQFVSIEIQNQINDISKNLWEIEKINNFIQLLNYLNQNQKYINNFNFKYFLNTPSAVTLHFKNSYDIYLTLNNQIIDAFKTAEEFLNKEGQNKSIIFDYIDMRYYPEKLYYK